MKTLLLFLISGFAFSATTNPFLSNGNKIDFNLDFIENIYGNEGYNNSRIDEVTECVNIWLNCSTEEIQYSTTILEPGNLKINGFINVSIYSGPSETCQNDILLYHGEHLGTTGSIPLSSLNTSILCSQSGLDYITVYIKYQWGSPSQYCAVTKVLELCN
ncbi:MAG TPA: hypothetical protein VKY36_02270 [Moheibacter sp.]|nr:hypothetical protein [Moheibacter sp.]